MDYWELLKKAKDLGFKVGGLKKAEIVKLLEDNGYDKNGDNVKDGNNSSSMDDGINDINDALFKTNGLRLSFYGYILEPNVEYKVSDYVSSKNMMERMKFLITVGDIVLCRD